MSMKIERGMHGRGFEVKLYKIRGKSSIKDLEELTVAIAHYFGIHEYHKEHASKCPFCEEIRTLQ